MISAGSTASTRASQTESTAPSESAGPSILTSEIDIEEQHRAAKEAHDAAKSRLRRVERIARYHQIRLWTTQHGIPPWVLALVAGSVTALLMTLILALLRLGLSLLLIGTLLSYVAAAVTIYWLFRGAADENDDNRLQRRSEKVRLAQEERRRAIEVMVEADAALDRIRQSWNAAQQFASSEAHRRQLETARLLSIDPGRLYPDEFERYVADIFSHLGFVSEVTGRSGDQGVDILACKGPLRIAVQAKRHIGAVGNAAVQEVYAGMAHHKCHRSLVITSSDFTQGAVALAESTGCILIGGNRIASLIRGEITF